MKQAISTPQREPMEQKFRQCVLRNLDPESTWKDKHVLQWLPEEQVIGTTVDITDMKSVLNSYEVIRIWPLTLTREEVAKR